MYRPGITSVIIARWLLTTDPQQFGPKLFNALSLHKIAAYDRCHTGMCALSLQNTTPANDWSANVAMCP